MEEQMKVAVEALPEEPNQEERPKEGLLSWLFGTKRKDEKDAA